MNTSFNITVTHTLAPELIDILKNFSRGADPLQTTSPALALEEKTGTSKSKTTKKELTAVTGGNGTSAEEYNSPETMDLSTEQVRAKTMEVIQSGKRDGVQKLLTEFGVGKLVDLPKDQYTSFFTKVSAL